MTNYSTYSQHQKILTLMCQYPDKHWWFAKDFQLPEQGELFVGYEATARLSELAKLYPEMVESQHAGKFIKRRIQVETIKEWLPDLPKDLRYIFHRTGHTSGLPPTAELKKPEPAPVEAPTNTQHYRAAYISRKSSIALVKNSIYNIEMNRLVVGQEIVVRVNDIEMRYANLQAFRLDWKVL